MPGINELVVRRASCVQAFGQWKGDTLKHVDDLRRYDTLLAEGKVEVIVELGRYNGASARWFREYAPVISVDTVPVEAGDWAGITCLTGDSLAEDTCDQVWRHVEDRAAMVVLDSDHSTQHVLREIILYAPLVGPRCHLVIEDTILAWLPKEVLERHTCWYEGDPMQAMRDAHAAGFLDAFTRDTTIEAFDGAPTMHPSGWWRCTG